MLISQGTSRYVYDIGNGFVKKIPIDKHGIWQNESEIRIHNNNIDSDLILHIEDYDENGEWVIQRKCNPLSENTTHIFKQLTGADWQELCDLTHSVRRMIRSHKKKDEPIHTTYEGDNKFLKKFEKYLIDNSIDFFEDFRDPTNWGILDGKIYLIDYGMDSLTFKKYISRDMNKIIAMCAILKDEHQYLREWIEYHKSIGIDQIYLYEDVTSKTHKDIVKDYEHVYLKSIGDFIDLEHCLEKQRDVYNKFIETHKSHIDYTFFIDLDEFVTFADEYTMEDLIKQCDETGSVLLPWKHYGACGHIDNPKTDVVTTYHTHTDIKFPKNLNGCKLMAKAFVNMKEGRMKHIHYHTHSVPIVPWDSEDLYTKCWLNHYITKSWEEWCNRLFVRGQNMALRKPDEFFDYNPDMLSIKEELYKKDCFKIDNYIVDGKIENILL